MAYLLSPELAQAVLNYLAERPYAEVYQLVARLQKLIEAPEGPEEETSSDESPKA